MFLLRLRHLSYTGGFLSVSALSGFMSVIFGNFHWGRLGECFLGSLLELGSERSVGVDYVIALYVAGTYWLVTGIQSG